MSISVGFGGISNPSSIYDTIEPKNLSEKLDLAEAKESSKHPLINIIKNKPELHKRSKSNNTNHSSISLGSSGQNNKKSYKRKNIGKRGRTG